LAADGPTVDGLLITEQHKGFYPMAIHSPACEQLLSELLTAPIDSVAHRMAAEIEALDDVAAVAYLCEVVTEDPADSAPYAVAALLFPHLRAEVAR
jgi:hypothetical protein